MELQSVPALISELERQGFYGSLELKFEAGKIVLARKSETLKPAEHTVRYGDNPGGKNVKT